jgi:hypothetical protein
MLKINGVERGSAVTETEDAIIQGPNVYTLEVEDLAGNCYQILTNESTVSTIESLMNLIRENTKYDKEA